MSPGSRELSGSPRRRAKSATFASTLQWQKIMFSARKAKPAARHPQQSVAPQVESSTTGSSRQIERTATGSSLDDLNESSRRGDVALCCAYVLQGSDWAPVNNSRPDDLSGESRFLAAKIVQDEDMAKRRFFEPLATPGVQSISAPSRHRRVDGVGVDVSATRAGLRQARAQGAGTTIHAARGPRAKRARSGFGQEVRPASTF